MRIVIVDDDRALLESLSVILAQEGHQVKALNNSRNALAYFEAAPELDVLILDYLLPDGTGCELLARLRDRLPASCRVIMTSGHTDRLDFDELRLLGIDAFLPKPVDLERLFALLDDQAFRIAAQAGSKLFTDVELP